MSNTLLPPRSKFAATLFCVASALFACGAQGAQHGGSLPSGIARKAPVTPPPPTQCVGVWCPCQSRPPEHACPDWTEVLVTTTVYGARGMFTSPSFLTNAPVGATELARNAVVDVPGEYTTRPGFERLANGLPGDVPIQAWTVYKGRIIAHTGDRLWREDPDAPGGWTRYSGSYPPPSPGQDPAGMDITGKARFFEAQQALYFTSTSGVYRLEELTGTPVLSGVPQALTGTVSLIEPVVGGAQALNDGFITAYRYVWGRRAANGRVHLGAPSGRITISNNAGGPRDVQHSIPIPVGVDASHFLQVYRADEVPNTTVASDEMYLVHEKPFADMAVTFTASAMSRTGSVVTVDTPGPHGLLMGQTVTLVDMYVNSTDQANFPPGPKIVASVVDADTFTYNGSGPVASSSGPFYFTAASTYVFIDTTPDALKADALYTNVNFNSLGIGASRYRPPLANAVVTFGDRSFFGNVELLERVTLNLLGIGGLTGLNNGQGLQFLFEMGGQESYTGSTTGESFPNTFQIFTAGTPAQNVANTTKSLARAINSRGNGRLHAHYASSDVDLPGQIIIESRNLGRGRIVVEALQRGDMWAPALTATQRVNPGSISRTPANLVTVFPTTTTPGIGHGLVVGQVVELLPAGNPTDQTNFPPGKKIITAVPTIDSFRYVETNGGVPGTVTNANVVFFRTTQEEVTTENEEAPGGWMASDAGNPDSVPFTVPEIAGDRYKRLYRFLVLGNSLFMLKEDGLFRLTGSSPETFSVDHVDSTVRFVAPSAAVVIGGRAYAITTQGLMSWTEATRPEPASVPVEDVFRNLVDGNRELVEQHAFAVNDDAARRAYFFLPDPSNTEEPGASQVYVYHTLTDAWTKWEKRGATALVHPVDGKLYVAPPPGYFGAPTAAPPYKERRSGSNADYVDEDGGPIETVITHTENFAPSPHLEKQFVWTTWHFRDEAPSLVDVGFATNYDPTPIYFPLTSDDSQEPGTVSTPPTMEHSRGRYLQVSIRHAQVGVPLRLLGYAVRSRHYEAR